MLTTKLNTQRSADYAGPETGVALAPAPSAPKLREVESQPAPSSPWEPSHTVALRPGECAWTVLIPFFNERLYLPATLWSLAAQDRPFRVILIDNGSTDGGAEIAAAQCRRLGLAFTLVVERRPGKVHALAAGFERVRTPFVATCDADTWYPSDYLSQAAALLAGGADAAGAFFIPRDAEPKRRKAAGRRISILGRLLPSQCHTGGAGQVFRTASLRRAGGFDPARWGFVLEDHEIMHRVAGPRPIAYGPEFWCTPADRARDRASIRWSLFERLLYNFTPARRREWFFYDFLAPRLKARRMTSDRIRERQFQVSVEPANAASYSLCG